MMALKLTLDFASPPQPDDWEQSADLLRVSEHGYVDTRGAGGEELGPKAAEAWAREAERKRRLER